MDKFVTEKFRSVRYRNSAVPYLIRLLNKSVKKKSDMFGSVWKKPSYAHKGCCDVNLYTSDVVGHELSTMCCDPTRQQ